MQQEKSRSKKKNILKFYIVIAGSLSLLLINTVKAKSLSSFFYYPSIETSTINFMMESPEITNFLVTKKILKEKSKLKVRVLKKKEKSIELVIITNEKLALTLKNIIKKTFMKKADLILGNKTTSWLRGYYRSKNSKHHKVYIDKKGILKKSNIVISYKSKTMTIEEKQPIGTKRTLIEFSRPTWSKSKAVINKVSQVSFHGSETIRTQINYFYEKTKSGEYFPVKILSKSTHGVNFESANIVKKATKESFWITDYKKIP